MKEDTAIGVFRIMQGHGLLLPDLEPHPCQSSPFSLYFVEENAFGILSTKFQIFKRTIIADPVKITKAACCLHRFVICIILLQVFSY